MTIRPISIQARWDRQARVWTATSNDVAGLVVEADTWAKMIEETELVLPDLLSLSGSNESKFVLTFKRQHTAYAVLKQAGLPKAF